MSPRQRISVSVANDNRTKQCARHAWGRITLRSISKTERIGRYSGLFRNILGKLTLRGEGSSRIAQVRLTLIGDGGADVLMVLKLGKKDVAAEAKRVLASDRTKQQE